MGAKQGQKPGRGKRAGLQRLALIVFGALFVVLFVGFAIAEGIGDPSVPEGDVALVKGVPSDVGSVSEADFKRALIQQAASGGIKKLPKSGEKKYEELKEAALGELLDAIWIQGEAEELGITVTPKQIDTELIQIKKQNFKTDAEYEKFLKTSKFTQDDVLQRVKLQVLSNQIQERISGQAPQPTSAGVSQYYDAAKDTQYTTPESRDVRVIVNKDKAKVEVAKAQLEKDDSAASWKKVAPKYSSDPTTKTTGGLQKGLNEELLKGQGALADEVFGNPTGVLAGPFEFKGSWFLIEVEKLNPAKTQALDEVKAQIKSQLAQQISQEYFAEFVAEYQSKWQSRTFCAAGFTVERCANYRSDGRPANAPPACYEANPKAKTAPECPAPVTQNQPALPGSVSILKPQGERLAQRPRPEGLKEAAESALTLPEGVTPEGVPPTGE